MENNLDNDLILEFVKGSELAFNKLVRKYQKMIYWHARRMVGNHLDADEVTQQVIIVIYEKLKNFKFNSSLKTWIYKITQTRSLNLIKRRKVKNFLNINDTKVLDISDHQDIVGNYDDVEKLNRLNIVLGSLPIKQREVFVFRHFEELSYNEISEITGKSIGGLKANYFHASKKIMEIMKNE